MPRKKSCYCAFCKTPRQVNFVRGVRWVHVFASLICALLLTLLFFHEIDPRGFYFFIFSMTLAEVFLRIRWRIHIVCSQCGFDPVLYLKEPAKAAQRVKTHLDRRQKSADFLLAPQINLPTIKVSAPTSTASVTQPGSLLQQRV